jgi:hypothetical protein
MIVGIVSAALHGLEAFPELSIHTAVDKQHMLMLVFLWFFSTSAIGQAASQLEEDIRQNMVEPLLLSRYPVWALLFVRSVSHTATGVLLSLALLWCLSFATAIPVFITFHSAVALLLLDVALTGMGLAIAGVVILFKRTGFLLSMIYLTVGTCVAARVATQAQPGDLALPGVAAVDLFVRAATGDNLGLRELFGALYLGLAWLGLGAFVLERCIARARRTGTLTHR